MNRIHNRLRRKSAFGWLAALLVAALSIVAVQGQDATGAHHPLDPAVVGEGLFLLGGGDEGLWRFTQRT